jgi:hypothetical protein
MWYASDVDALFMTLLSKQRWYKKKSEWHKKMKRQKEEFSPLRVRM